MCHHLLISLANLASLYREESMHNSPPPSNSNNPGEGSNQPSFEPIAIANNHSGADSEQSGRDLLEFTPFPNLPIEIRLKIWRTTFPRGKMVHLGDEYILRSIGCSRLTFGTSQQPPTPFYPLRVEIETPLPVTLRINSESRHETLRHYITVHRTDLELSPSAPARIRKARPFCYNPKLDTAWITYVLKIKPLPFDSFKLFSRKF
jgi:hypothetical protein